MHLDEKWIIKGRKGDAKELAERIGVSKRLAALLILKLQNIYSQTNAGDGYEREPDALAGNPCLSLADAANEYLKPDLSLLYDGSLMKDMDKALAMLKEAVASQKKTLIIGDYDVDGIMGAVILHRALKKALDSIDVYIPHRVDDGYGINDKIVNSAYESGVRLILTCDNGMSAHKSIALAKSLHMDVVVTDHHDVPGEETSNSEEGCGLPPADAVVNPKRSDCGYPFKDLCGAAVAYKLAVAFAADMNIGFSDDENDELLCYAAVATICDIVGLVDENRRIVYHGLNLLNACVINPGMAELVDACGLTGKKLTTYEVGHIIGPCINAAGRLDTAELSYDLFTECDPARIGKIASEMLDLNRRRQELTANSFDDAVSIIEREGMSRDRIIVLYMPDTHESICGIVAGKLKDKYARPAIVLTESASGLQSDMLKGSGRSVEGYDLLGCVKTAAGLLDKFGGHKMAVGISVVKDNLAPLRDALIQNCDIGEDMLIPQERIDLCLEPKDITMDLVNDVMCLEPFGRGNEKPVFAFKGLTLEYASLIGSRRNVVKMKLRHNSCRDDERSSCAKPFVDAVFFGDAGLFMRKLDLIAGEDGIIVSRGSPRVVIDATFFPEINEYNGVRKVQLIIRSVRKAV